MHCSTHLGDLFVARKHIPCLVHNDHELYAKEQNCLEPRLDFLLKLFQSLTGWQFSVPELCPAFSEAPYPSSVPTIHNHKVLKSGDVDGHENPSVRFLPVQYCSFFQNVVNKTRYGIAGVRSGIILLK
jgi:hypothetical protein